MLVTLPFTTPVTNVLRFLLIEYVILKLFDNVTEALTKHITHPRKLTRFQEHWPGFFLVSYRVRHATIAGKLIPITIALLLNAFLLSTEFAFSSVTSQRHSFVTSMEEISTPELGESVSLNGMTWISRVDAISSKCVTRNQEGLEIYAVEGFVKNLSLNDPSPNFEAAGLDIICFDDSRVKVERLNRVILNITHSGMDAEQPFLDADAVLTVDSVAESLFDFVSGDVDIKVQGRLTLSQPDRDSFSHNVTGSCTGFLDNDPRVYCYLSDGAEYRFIFPSEFSADSDVQNLSEVSAGNELRLSQSGPVFRAHVFIPNDEFYARDGDHLAAIKSLVTTFAPRQNAKDDPRVAQLYYPIVTRTFYIATVLGGTSLRMAPVEMQVTGEDMTERAQVTLWALVMICVVVGLLFGLSGLVWGCGKRFQRWNIPVSYNELAEMVMDESSADQDFQKGGKKRVLTCALRDDGFVTRYRPVDPNGISGEEISEGVWEGDHT